MQPLLSICIATFRRADFIAQTLDSILGQWQDDVELVVVDGASPDGTQQVMTGYVERYPHIVYRRESTNSGVDADYDKAVGYARGEYCWLMSDDDLLAPGALARVLQLLRERDTDLLVLDVEVRSRTLAQQLMARRCAIDEPREWGAADFAAFVEQAILHVTFIATTVIRRSVWLARERQQYFGYFFIHVGVIAQAPLQRIRFVPEPLVVMRDGNSMWTPRSFEVWMRRWPQLVWSFGNLSEGTRRKVSPPHPAHDPKMLLWLRALGGFDAEACRRWVLPELHGWRAWGARLAARFPRRLANALVAAYCAAGRGPEARMKMYALVRSPAAGAPTRALARLRGVHAD